MIGSGPGGQKAAIASAKLGKSVAIVERGRMLGGVCVNTGTIPSKTLREAVLYLTGMTQRELYGASYRVKDRITPADLLARTEHVINKEIDVVRNQLMRNRVDLLVGHARFVDPHTIAVEDPTQRETTTITGDYIVIATGTTPARPAGVEFDEDRVLDSDGILDLKSLPTSMVVVGAGVIGIEYASMFAALGTTVTVVEKRHHLLDFCDPEVVEALKFHLRDLAVDVPVRRRGDRGRRRRGRHGHHFGQRQTDSRRHGDVLRRTPGPDRSSTCENAGLEADDRGRICGRRQLPDQGAAHLRRRRRHRLPRARSPRRGAGPPRRLPRVRSALRRASPRCCRSASTRSPRSPASARPRRS